MVSVLPTQTPNFDICSIQKLLPKQEHVQSIETLPERGFTNNLSKIVGKRATYILRSPKTPSDDLSFQDMQRLAQQAAKKGIAPRVIGTNSDRHEMLLEYIPHLPWPKYEENPTPYHKTMHVLRSFHTHMRRKPISSKSFSPFGYILEKGRELCLSPRLPSHMTTAMNRIETMFKSCLPWLQKNATVCHGDFHTSNVLLSSAHRIRPFLIDFDNASIGDPLFDVVKFSVSLQRKQRLALLQEYLGETSLSPHDKAHFQLMDLALLMVVVIVRYTSALKKTETGEERLSKDEMEALLDSKKRLPSFLKIPFKDTSIRARQLGATYALSRFLRQTNETSLQRLFKALNT